MSEHAGEPKLNAFEPASYDEWLKLVDRDLKGAPFDKKLVKRIAGIDISPLYMSAAGAESAGLPGIAPFTRGSQTLGNVENGWDVRQIISNADVSAAARAVGEELQGGATSVLLELDEATRSGIGELGHDGIACANLADLERVLEALLLDKTPVALDAGVSTLPVAAGLFALAKKRGVDVRALSGSLGADPLACLARFGGLPTTLERAYGELVQLAQFTHAHAPHMRSVCVDSAPYHEAGADAATEIGIALATGITYLRAMTDAGMEVSQAAKQIVFRFSIGRDFFLEIAKLRAARSGWARVVAACGGDASAQAMVLHATTSKRTKTERDPWVNLLRATAESFSAAVGGADAITTGSFDEVIGESDEFARHLARNTQHLLRHESHLHRVIDAPGGSFYLESLTDALAKQAWTKLQSIEQRGTLPKLLVDGTLQAELKQALDAEGKAVERRKIAITGVNEFPHVREEKLTRAKADAKALELHAAAARGQGEAALLALGTPPSVEVAVKALEHGATFIGLRAAWSDRKGASAQALTRARLGAPFEALRDMADRTLAQTGKRPRVFLANLGPIPAHKARAQFAQNFVEAGGFEALTNEGFASAEAAAQAFAESGAEVCAICSSDEVYAELATAAAQAIAAKGPKALVLAGSPGENETRYREAGVTDFIFMGMNVVESLRSLLARAGAV